MTSVRNRKTVWSALSLLLGVVLLAAACGSDSRPGQVSTPLPGFPTTTVPPASPQGAKAPSAVPTFDATSPLLPAATAAATSSTVAKELSFGPGLTDFTLPNANGDASVKLSSYLGKKNVVLVFYRAYW
ncbi:MAG: hypothetical protein EXR57_03050 [Dehalococcoidia bacterium]|nr:hypothetical protein [Dehalococcoidia bacterium]MSQ34779.1 hypothetical protein [Dehalococcoidia bacterium]